ncbi:MAG: sensor histidine kinase [Flammeovirgaceae bacterium]|nr:sensor histidine kinase [Flammeovirgaceae bacterium]
MILGINLSDVRLRVKIPVYSLLQGICSLGLITTLLIFGNSDAFGQGGKNEIDSLKNLAKNSRDSVQFEVYFELLRRTVQSDKNQAFGFAEMALENSRYRGDSLGMVRSYSAMGIIKRSTAELKLAIGYLKSGLEITSRNKYISSKYVNQQKYILNALAGTYTDMANYDKALEYHFESLAIRELERNLEDLGVAYNNIGVVYLAMKDYENGLIYFQKSKAAKDEGKVNYDYVVPLVNIGHCYNGLNRFSDAIQSFLEVFELCKTRDCSKDNLMIVHKALGEAYIGAGYLDKAFSEIATALELSKTLNEPKYESSSLYHLARIYKIRKNYSEAIKMLDESQIVATDKTELRNQVLINYQLYSEISSDQGNFKASNDYQKKYIDLNEAIYNADLIKNIARVQSVFEERENLKIIADKDQILELKEQVIANQRAMSIFIGVITLLVFGLAFVLYTSNRLQHKANRALEAAKTTIEEQNIKLSSQNVLLEDQVNARTQELNDTNASLTKVVDELDHFIYKTSHDIRGPLASLKGICNVAMIDVTDKMALEYLSKLDVSADKLNSILTRLLIINKINHATLTSAPIDFAPIIDEILIQEKKKGIPENLVINRQVNVDVDLKSDNELVAIILENLIDNAIKFHNESPRVTPFVNIRIETEGNKVAIRVIDNGIGIKHIDKEKIFQMFVRASQRSDTGGIGLYLSKLATEKLDGVIDLRTTKEGYTEFIVKLPADLGPILAKRIEVEKKKEIERLAKLEKQKQLQDT